MGCIGLLLAILGIFGYANQIWWCSIWQEESLQFLTSLLLISGELRCLGTIITVGFWVSAYRQTGSLVDGLVLGSCLSTVVMVVVFFIFMTFTAGISVAISGLTSIYDWIKNINK